MFSVTVEEGAVFVYINNKRDSLDLSPKTLHGELHAMARFGTSIASAKDLNNDGFEDVVIGAPYDEEGRGAVYLYHGSRNGLQVKYSQKITPSQFGFRGLSLRAFGASLSCGIDVDDNGYPDLAIGSFLSDNAVVLKSKPVAKVDAKVVLQMTQINPKLTKHLCLGPDGKTHICLGIQICFTAGGKNVPLPVDVNYEFSLDEQEPVFKRGVFFENSLPSYRIINAIQVRNHACRSFTAFMNMKPRNIYQRLVFKVAYTYQPSKNCDLCPVMKPGSAEATASYAKNCGADLVCKSDLDVSVKILLPDNKEKVHVGVTEIIGLDISLKNHGESAFLSGITVLYPVYLFVVGVRQDNKMNVQWNLENHNKTHNLLSFEAGNPIESSEEEKYDVKFSVDDIPFDVKRLNFDVETRTSSGETNKSNNRATASVGVLIVADLTISGVAIPDQITYNSSQLSGVTGPFILHKFLIQNKGPGTVESSRVDLFFPEKLRDDYIMNLLAVTVEGSVSCNINESSYNPVGLKLKPNDEGKESLSRKRRMIEEKLDCNTGRCQIFSCEIGRLRRGQNVGIFINSSLVESTFVKKVKKDSIVAVRAVVVSNAVKQPALHFPDTSEPTIHILSPKKPNSKEKGVPWWIVLISVIAGLGLIAGVVFVLHMSGFFNRKKRDYSFGTVPVDEF